MFKNKSVRVLGLHIWSNLLETLNVESFFTALKRSLNYYLMIVYYLKSGSHLPKKIVLYGSMKAL